MLSEYFAGPWLSGWYSFVAILIIIGLPLMLILTVVGIVRKKQARKPNPLLWLLLILGGLFILPLFIYLILSITVGST